MGLSGYTGLPVTLNGISGRKWVNYILLLLIIILFIYFLSGLWASFVHPEPKGPWLFGFPCCPPGGGHELWQQCGCRLLESPGRKNTVQRLEVKHVLFKYIRETHFELQFFSFYNSPIVFSSKTLENVFPFFYSQELVLQRRMSSMSAVWWSPTVCTGWWKTNWCLMNRLGPPSPASPCWPPLRSELQFSAP